MIDLKPVRVLIVDDSPDLAEAMARMIRRTPGLEDAGTLGSADALIEEVRGHRADVVLIDLTMPGTPPLDAIEDLTRAHPDCRVLACSGFDDPETVSSALGAGAHGYVSKNLDVTGIIEAIRKVAGPASTP